MPTMQLLYQGVSAMRRVVVHEERLMHEQTLRARLSCVVHGCMSSVRDLVVHAQVCET